MLTRICILVGLFFFISCKKQKSESGNPPLVTDPNPYILPKWNSIGSGLPNNNSIKNLIVLNDSNIVVSEFSQGLYKTSNKGSLWNAVLSGTGIGSQMTSFTSSGDTIYAGNDLREIFLSTNKGNSWSQISSGFPGMNGSVTGIYSLKKVDSYLFVGTTAGVFRTSLNGSGMVYISNGLPATYGTNGDPQLFVSSIANIQNYIYITTSKGIYKSTDYGNTWIQSNSGMPTITYDGFSGKYINMGSKLIYGSFYYLYISTRGAGVYFSSDLGLTWQPMNAGLTNLDILYMEHIGDYYYVVNSQYEIYLCNTLNLTPQWSKTTMDGLPSLPSGLITSMAVSKNKIFVSVPNSVYVFE